MPQPNPRQLLDEKFVSQYFSQKITGPRYQAAIWNSVKIIPIKKHLHQKNNLIFYHFVIRYDIPGLNQPIFCSAHSQENRKPAFNALKFIHSQIKNYPLAPLFYSPNFNAFFYLGLSGENLQYYLKKQPQKVPNLIKLAANRLADFHQIKINPKKHNFNPKNQRVETVVPGAKIFFQKIKFKAPSFSQESEAIFQKINQFDQKNLPQNGHYLIHGDIHPENIIIGQQLKIAIVDYTDICVADFARDLASFSHQLNYMTTRFNPCLAKKLPQFQKIFFETYLKKRKMKMTPDLNQRIKYYLAWTALRNLVFFLTKNFIETEEAKKSLQSAKEYLKLE